MPTTFPKETLPSDLQLPSWLLPPLRLSGGMQMAEDPGSWLLPLEVQLGCLVTPVEKTE